MIKALKKYALVIAVGAMAVMGFTGCGGSSAIDGTKAAAVVNNEDIPMGVASLYARYQQAQMYSFYGAYFGSTGIFDTVTDEETGTTYGETMKEGVMTTLEELYVLRQHAADYDVTLTEEETTAINDAAKSFVTANDAEVLTTMGVSESDVATLLELLTYQSKMYDAMIADTDTEVSDDEAAQSRVTFTTISLAGTETDEEGNTIELTDEEKAEKEALANQVLEAMQASSDVANEDMNTVASGIDETLTASTVTFGADSTSPDQSIRDAVVGLDDGAMVDHVVTSEDGNSLYVVRLDATFDAEATETEKESIITQREQENYQTELDGWIEESDIDVKTSEWNKITITDANVFTFKTEETTEETTDNSTTVTVETQAEATETPAEATETPAE